MKFDANVGGVKTNKLGSTVTVQGEGTEADANYSGKNIKTFIGQDSSGNTTIDVKMNKNLEVETVTATGAMVKMVKSASMVKMVLQQIFLLHVMVNLV